MLATPPPRSPQLSPMDTPDWYREMIATPPPGAQPLEEEEDKEFGGLPQFLNTVSPPICHQESNISEDSWKWENLKRISYTGNVVLLSTRKFLYANLETLLEFTMARLPAPKQLCTTFGRKILECQELSSNWAQNLLIETLHKTGMPSGILLSEGSCWISLPIFVLDVTLHSEESMKIFLDLCQEFLLVECFGVQQEPVKVEGRGRKQAWTLTLRIPELSFGLATAIKNMLSLTSLEVTLIYLTSYDGWIGTRLQLKSRAQEDPYAGRTFGFPQIRIREIGTQD